MDLQKERLMQVLYSYDILTEGVETIPGPTVTLYKIKPTLGTRISKIRNLKDEIAYGLSVQGVRIVAPMEDGTVGIEVPNRNREIIPMDEIIYSDEYENSDMELPITIGRTISGDVFSSDLTTMPHLLVAGATGQGKSVALNMMLMSLLNKRTPEELQLILIDPKQVELSIYSSLEGTYLASPIITNTIEAEKTLRRVCILMDDRYSLLKDAQVRNIQDYNMNAENKLPYIVVVVDEYADLTMASSNGKSIEQLICRIAQKARAVGIHLIISTQRPDTKVITGTIKANFPTRIAFRTTTSVDSRVILDQVGAEKLTGKGDFIFFQGVDVFRAQCAYVSSNDIDETLNSLIQRYKDYKPTELWISEEKERILKEEREAKEAGLSKNADFFVKLSRILNRKEFSHPTVGMTFNFKVNSEPIIKELLERKIIIEITPEWKKQLWNFNDALREYKFV